MSLLRPILKPILAATLPIYATVSIMLISIVATLEVAGYIALYYPQNALSALSLVFFLLESMSLYNIVTRRSDNQGVWNNARVPIPVHWRRAILDVITWVRASKGVQMLLFYAAIGIFMVITWGTMDFLKVIDASIFVDLLVTLLWSFVGIFLFITGLVLYRSALAPIDTVQGDALDAIVDALPTIGPRGIESMKRDRSISYSPKVMNLLGVFTALACAGSGIAAAAPFLGFPSMVIPGLDLSGVSIGLVVATGIAPLVSRKKSSLLRALTQD